MEKRKRINWMIACLCFLVAILLCYKPGIGRGWPWAAIAIASGIWHILLNRLHPQKKPESDWISSGEKERAPQGVLTEIILLSEDNEHLASWNIYQKNGVVIGRDVGENQVAIDLEHTTYASMIDVEHAVLNYSGNDWYIEDTSNRNGVSVQKMDGKRYKLSYGKPCKLERWDIIYIAMTKLQIL